ncbi:MAG TPA: glycosyltransferase family 1 protein [Patescibacteria group bacterium]|nr:glycosyltransferase family 1 protein [Patescibacteria group bacterium]
MKVGIDISPLSSGHKVRGVGFYVKLLKDNIAELDKKNEYSFFEGNPPPNLDLVHYPYFDPFQITLPSHFSNKTMVTVHDLTPIVFGQHFPAGLMGKLRWAFQKKRLKRVDSILADSECSKKDIVKITGISEEKIKVVYLAANKIYKKIKLGSNASQVKKKFSLPDEFVLYVGDATWNKNLPKLIESIKKTSYKLVLVGKVWENTFETVSDNPWNEDLKKVLKEIDQDEQFIKLGFVSDEDLAIVYNLATVFIMPSIYEGFGLPVLEAMSCGTPVITTRGGSLPEVAGQAGYYVDVEDVENIREGINAMMTDKKLRDLFSKKSIEQSKKFSIKKMITDTVSSYASV